MGKKKDKDTVHFVAAGDVFLGGKIVREDGTFKEVITYKPKSAFNGVAPIFQEADVAFCNLESSLSDRGAPQKGRASAFISRPENIHVLKSSGIDVVSFANNHSMDFGPEAMLHTLELLDRYGIHHAGAGADSGEARRPALIEKKGMTLAFLAYATNINVPPRTAAGPQMPGLAMLRLSPYFPPPHVNTEDLKAMESDVRQAKKKADFVIVSCHWGVSDGGTHSPATHQRGIGQAAIRAGADCVLGHHQHAYQGVELYRGKIICHGLGNFIFNAISSPFSPGTVLFHCSFQKNKMTSAWLQPIIQDMHSHPHPLLPEDELSRQILSHLQELSKSLGVRLKVKDGRAVIPLLTN